MVKIVGLVLLLCLPGYVNGQVRLVENGKSRSKIIVTHQAIDHQAGELLQDFLSRITGTKLALVVDQKPQKGDVLIGNFPNGSDLSQLSEDGFRITTTDHILRITSGGGKGTIYGVVTLLENYLGVSYWGDHEYQLNPQSTIALPKINHFENPAFRYRQSQCYALTDSIYRYWNRLEEPAQFFVAGYWVHTCDRLLPADVYGAAHPEYYAYYKGQRNPGKASQWCLTNPEVFDIVCHRLDSLFKANPQLNRISVSQNDGNDTYCRCPSCQKIIDEEGSPSGPIITFLNKLAARFPDKEFSTLAYLYSMNPPQHIKPAPNVNIMLCDIDCYREVSLTENASGKAFVKALEGWAKITNNIFVWDYGINFDNYVSPFPNFHILQDNIQLFKKNHATMHFSQIGGSKGGDFPELRAYLVSKLMWNPQVDVDSLTHHFLDGYYGKGGAYIYEYQKIMEGALLGSGKGLWIYDSPVTHKDGMLKPELMRRYNELFDKAEAAVSDDSTRLMRVQRARLPLQFAALEIARTQKEKNLDSINKLLNLFEKRVGEFDIPTLNERGNAPLDYCKLYRERYLPQTTTNLASGAKITYIQGPSDKYKDLDPEILVDNLFGGSSFVESWIGWKGKNASFIMDLGAEKTFHSVSADFLHQLGAWVLLPKKVSYFTSSDNKTYTRMGSQDLPEDRSVAVKFVGLKVSSPTPIKARYIRVEVKGTITCPPWHYGVGYDSWFFLDEVTVH